MRTQRSTLKVHEILDLHKKKRLNFDLAIQRKANAWTNKRFSKFVQTMLLGWPTHKIFATKEGRSLSILEGLQRLSKVLRFLEGKITLDKTTPMVNDIDIAGKKFAELPEEFQERILNYTFDIDEIKDATAEEMEELFFRLNDGVPLRNFEKTRAVLGGKHLKYIEDIAKTPFLQTKTKISKKGFVDQELVMQVLALLHFGDTGLGGTEIQNLASQIRSQRVKDELKSKVQNASHFLNLAFVKKEAFLKKTHVPMLFKLVLDFQAKNLVIEPSEFEEWAINFFENIPADYEATFQNGSAKKENVQKRLQVIKDHFEKWFKVSLTDEDEDKEESVS